NSTSASGLNRRAEGAEELVDHRISALGHYAEEEPVRAAPAEAAETVPEEHAAVARIGIDAVGEPVGEGHLALALLHPHPRQEHGRGVAERPSIRRLGEDVPPAPGHAIGRRVGAVAVASRRRHDHVHDLLAVDVTPAPKVALPEKLL